jgi:hypothetical protein
MAKKAKKRLEGYSSPKRRWRWIDKLTSEERQAVEEEVRYWLDGEYPDITSVPSLFNAMRAAGLVHERVTLHSFAKWIGEFRGQET